MLLLILASAVFAANAEFSLVPEINEAVIGTSIYFDCTTTTHTNEVQWYHYRVGAKDHEDTCLYCIGKTHPQYENRIEVLHNSSTDTYRLRIKSVQLDDAGTYICQDNGGIGDSLEAELVVLASAPICHTNMKPDGLLGPNSCNIAPEGLQMSCNVVYHGNISPVLQWREIRSIDYIDKGLYCSKTGFKVTCDVALKASFDLHGSSYVCETTTSSMKRYNCSADVVRVIHANANNSVSKLAYGTKETVICSANSSQMCSYTWKWTDEGYKEAVVSNIASLIPSISGWYKCEAECNIRGKQCTVLSGQILVSEESVKYLSEVKRTPLSTASVILVVSVVLAIIVVIIYTRKKTFRQRFFKSQRNTLTDDSDESERSIGVKQHSRAITTKSAKEKGLLIRGMAIIDDELFVVTQRSSEVEAFDCKSLVSSRQWTLEGLIRPSDIGSCKTNSCLYIMDWKDDSMKKEVFCVDTNGKLLRSWITGDDNGDKISVSNDNNVIVTCFGKNEFIEYSPQGEMIRKISLQLSEYPTHAVKLSNDKFLVSGGDIYHSLHRVCIVNVLGEVQTSFGEEKGSDSEHLNQPMHLAVFTDGSVAVLDNGNRRVLLLDKDLQFNCILLSKTIHGLQNPSMLLLDESNDLLFVADIHKGAGEIRVFHIT